ncbi:MAG TPA: efflux RND transporter periplasmic adaptor subunit [Spongiibacteraceae bacterium]|jgi:RND family efflux transporter MFP subunit|nr:efflux RND transporter periplasmic adaptor subunit [Spongiibacteraceae bacterium]
MNRQLLWPAAVIALAVGVAVLLIATRPHLAPETPEPVYPKVRVVVAEPVSRELVVRSQGSVQPRSETDLISEVAGRVVWLAPSMVAGGYFEAGDTLLRLDAQDYQDEVARQRASLVRAEVERDTSEAEYQRFRSLREQKLASQSQLEQAERNWRVAAADYTDARARLDRAERDLARTALVAPYTGRVRSEHVDIGQFVARGEAIGALYATDYVEVRLPIANQQLGFLDLPVGFRGQLSEARAPAVTVIGEYAGQRYEWPGKLVRSDAAIDAQSRMFYAVARVNNLSPERPPLIVGLFVSADIQGRRVNDVYVLPREAMRDRERLLVVDADNRLRYRQVSVLRFDHEEVLIDAGLAPGDRVCVSALQVAVDGMRVDPELTAPSVARDTDA